MFKGITCYIVVPGVSSHGHQPSELYSQLRSNHQHPLIISNTWSERQGQPSQEAHFYHHYYHKSLSSSAPTTSFWHFPPSELDDATTSIRGDPQGLYRTVAVVKKIAIGAVVEMAELEEVAGVAGVAEVESWLQPIPTCFRSRLTITDALKWQDEMRTMSRLLQDPFQRRDD